MGQWERKMEMEMEWRRRRRNEDIKVWRGVVIYIWIYRILGYIYMDRRIYTAERLLDSISQYLVSI